MVCYFCYTYVHHTIIQWSLCICLKNTDQPKESLARHCEWHLCGRCWSLQATDKPFYRVWGYFDFPCDLHVTIYIAKFSIPVQCACCTRGILVERKVALLRYSCTNVPLNIALWRVIAIISLGIRLAVADEMGAIGRLSAFPVSSSSTSSSSLSTSWLSSSLSSSSYLKIVLAAPKISGFFLQRALHCHCHRATQWSSQWGSFFNIFQ